MNKSEDLLMEKRLSDFNAAPQYRLPGFEKVFQLEARLSRRHLFMFKSADDHKLEESFAYETKKNTAKRSMVTVILRPWICREERQSIEAICRKYTDKYSAFIDLSSAELTKATAEEYCRCLLLSEECGRNGDQEKAQVYKATAENVLVEWAESAVHRSMIYYDSLHPDGLRTEDYNEIKRLLKEHDLFYYPEYPERLDVPEELLGWYNLPSWGLYGADHREDVFESVPEEERRPSVLFAPIWTEDGKCRDGEDRSYVARLKRAVDGLIEEKLCENNRVGFAEIFAFLRKEPYGFTQNRLSCYLMGVLLRSYLFGDYYWTDDIHFEKLTAEHLDNAICKQVKNAFLSVPSLKTDYITIMDPDKEEFICAIEELFGIKDHSPAVSELRHKLRYALEALPYPLWALLYTEAGEKAEKIIHTCLCLADPDSQNAAEEEELFKGAGKLLKENPELRSKMRNLCTVERLTAGMNAFLEKTYGEDSGTDTKALDAYMEKSLITSEWKWLWTEETVAEILKK